MFIFESDPKKNTQREENVFLKRPLLKDMLHAHGQESLSTFIVHDLQSFGEPEPSRKEEFIDCFASITERRLGKETANGVRAQLGKYYGASSADHHGTINGSLAVNWNLLLSAANRKINDPALHYLIVLSCASVSLNNEDYPRGILFNSCVNEKYELQKLSILPSNSHNSLVYGFRPYLQSEVEKVEKVLAEKVKTGVVPAEQAAKVSMLLQTIYKREDILACKDLCDQFTKINHTLWKETAGRVDTPDALIYVELEELAANLLADHHMKTDSPLHALLFGKNPELLQSLTNAMELYLRQGSLATHLFWGIDEKAQRQALQLVGNELVTDKGDIRISMNPVSIEEALRTKKIMPNLLVIYTLIHLYYGMNCIGGFNQMHYLDAMRKVYNDSGCDTVPCNANSALYGYGLETLLLSDNAGTQSSLTAIDLLLHDSGHSLEDIRTHFDTCTLQDAFNRSCFIVHTLLYGSPDPLPSSL